MKTINFLKCKEKIKLARENNEKNVLCEGLDIYHQNYFTQKGYKVNGDIIEF